MLNLFAVIYQIETGTASKDIAQWAVQQNIFINSYAIRPHVGNFSNHKDDSNLFVVDKANSDHDVLYKKSVAIFGYPFKQYFVVRNP